MVWGDGISPEGRGVREPYPKSVKIYVQNSRILRIRFF